MPSPDDLKDYVELFCNKFKHSLKVVHINAQSLCDTAHNSEFHSVFVESNVDIIGVSETFFKSSSLTAIPNYNVFNVNRTDRIGGGVAVYVKECHKVKILSTSDGLSGKPEYIIMEVILGNEAILVACIYRPPKKGFMDLFLNDMYNFIPNYKYNIVCGDVNARFGSKSSETQTILETFELCNLTFLPFGNTYRTALCETALDVIACNCMDLLLECGQTPAPGFSAHDLLYAIFDLSTPTFKSKSITFRDYKNIDEEKLLNDAGEIPWHNVYKKDDIDSKVLLFNKYLSELMDKHAPNKTVKTKRNFTPWMTKGIRKLIRKRDKLRKKHLLTKSAEDFEKFRVMRNKVKQEIRNAKLRHYHAIFAKTTNSKNVWQAINSLGAGKNKEPSRNDLVVTPDELNKHYASVSSVKFPKLIDGMIDKYNNIGSNTTLNYEKFYFKYVLPEDIISCILSITSKAQGIDCIPATFLILCLPAIVPVLEHIFNFSLQNGCFPKLWKNANIIPVAKTTNPTECKDYRPISILCVLSKALEKVVHKQVSEFIELNNLFSKLQSGFRKGHSVTTALIKVSDDLRKGIDERLMTYLILLDLSKAFDCVHHELLIVKLKNLGFSISALSWFKGYLSEREHRVFINGNTSQWEPLRTGVPQGSVLGALLFILYLHDIASVILHCKYHLYADDIQLYLHFPVNMSYECLKLVIQDILNIMNFVNGHNLILNVSKTQAIIIGSHQYHKILSESYHVTQFEVNGISIPFQNSVNNLGVIFDSTLSWKDHCLSIVKKVLGSIAQLRRNASFIPLDIRKLLVQSLIFPQFDRCALLFTDLSSENMLRLQRAQNVCIRFISSVSRYEHITPFYTELSILKLAERWKLLIATEIWKVAQFKTVKSCKFLVPCYINDMFNFVSHENNRSTRFNGVLLNIPHHRTVKFNMSFQVHASRTYNELQLYNIANVSLRTFKRTISARITP